MRHLLILLLLGVAGGHFPATLDALQAGSVSQPGYGSDWAGDPLRATVWLDEYTGVASFELNRPAHVALFALQPLGGIELIYPHWGWGVGSERAFRTGQHSVRVDSRMYRLTRLRGHGRYGSGYRSGYRAAGQTYIVLIASERPLELAQFLATGTLPWLNHPSVTWNPFVATEQLAREIVPGQTRGEWTAAYHVIWPDVRLRRYDGRIPYTRVRCPGGVVVAVATHVLRAGGWRCPDRHAPPRRTARPRAPAPDTPPITDALPKRPRPDDWRGAKPPRAEPGAVPGKTGARPRGPARPVTPPSVRPVTLPPMERLRPRPAPAPTARPATRPATRPVVKPAPSPRPKPAVKPKPPPRPKAKKGGGGSGGGSGGG